MTKIAQIEERGAAVAWSPINEYADVLALGAKDSGSTGFDDYGGELELFNLATATSGGGAPSVIGSIKTTSRFSSIGWTKGASPPLSAQMTMGIIAGGMDNGAVNIYDPAKIANGSPSGALLSTIERKAGAISALQFNPHAASANLLATGSSNGEILITSLDRPEQPTVTVPSSNAAVATSTAEITQMAWNSEVAHIVAAAAGNGVVTIWDLRQNKPWCELRCEASGASVSDVSWNPSNGMHLITSCADDRNPVLKLWDLRASMSMPLATMEGHSQGILSTSWCPHDDSLLLSCGKDNKTILWDVTSLKPIADLQSDEQAMQNGAAATNTGATSMELYGSATGGLSSSQQKRYDVQWSPIRKGVISTCSFDRKVQTHSVISTATKCGRPPKWMKPASGVSCGFGGSIISFGASDKAVTIINHVEEPELKAAVINFESSTANGDYVDFSAKKAVESANAGDLYEAQLWGLMQMIFSENARQQLLHYLGFEPEEIAKKAEEFKNQTDVDVSGLSLEDKKSTPPMSKEAEETVNKALLVGNFEAAVECCVRSGNLADALVLASCGGAELWAKTQARYFASEIQKRPFLSVVSAVIHNRLGEFVAASDPENWHETLAVLCTYAAEDEFPSLCNALGDHLEKSGDAPNASLCYMCALNLTNASKYWEVQLQNAGIASSGNNNLALHTFVEKMAVFMRAGNQSDYQLSDSVLEALFKYAKVVSEQGLFPAAAKYCRSNSQECKELKDRLYRSKDSQLCTAAMGTPEFPYTYVNVGVAPVASIVRQSHQSSPAKTAQQSYSRSNPHNGSQRYGNTAANTATNNGPQKQVSQQTNGQYTNHSNGHHSHQAQNQYGSQTNAEHMQGNGPIQQAKPSEPQLSSGWTALQDPASGRTYYFNSQTGATTWEMPTDSSQGLAGSVPSAQGYQTQAASGTPQRVTTTAKLASKYGDGFVTSASHPQLAAQYGNVGTSNPYTDSARTGTAVFNKAEKPPVSGTFNLQKLSEVAETTHYKATLDDLLSSVTMLTGLPLGSSEKRQLAEVQKSVAIFSKRLGNGDIANDVADKVVQIVEAMKMRDFTAASGIHTSLVNSVWKEHKDWLKGIKFLIQMNAKAMHNSQAM